MGGATSPAKNMMGALAGALAQKAGISLVVAKKDEKEEENKEEGDNGEIKFDLQK